MIYTISKFPKPLPTSEVFSPRASSATVISPLSFGENKRHQTTLDQKRMLRLKEKVRKHPDARWVSQKVSKVQIQGTDRHYDVVWYGPSLAELE